MERLKIVLGCVGNAIITLLIINLIHFGIEIMQNGLGDSWYFEYTHGAFYSNEKLIGYQFGSSRATKLMFLFFSICLFINYRKGKLKF